MTPNDSRAEPQPRPPLPPNPRIAVVGSGAVGGYYGGRLAQHGHDVHFLLRSDYEAVRAGGWMVTSCDGDFVLPPQSLRVYNDPADMPKADLVFVTLKATANGQYERLIAPLLKPDTAVLTVQNGLGNEERLAELFGARRVLGGMAFACINRVGPGAIHHMDHGVIRLGEFGGGPSPRAGAVAALFRASKIACEVLPDLRFGRWQKLVWNVPFNGLGAAMDCTTDQLMGPGPGVGLVRELMAEVVAAAKGNGVDLPAGIVEKQIENTRTMGAYKSSMQVDRQAGRPMEVEAILGEPLRAAGRAGVATPLLATVYRMVSAVDAGRDSQGP